MIMNRLFTVCSVLVAVGASAAACSSSPSTIGSSNQTSTASQVVVAKPGFTALTRNVHALARPDLDVGRVDAAKPQSAQIVLKPTAAQVKQREQLIKDQQDPTSPKFHQWMTPEEIAAKFGPQKKDVDAVSSFLSSKGLKVEGVSHLGNRVSFSGSTAQVEEAFSTELHNYSINGKTHFAMSKAPQVPTELASVIMGVHGLHSFHAQPMMKQATPRPEYDGGSDPKTGYGFVLGPADFANLYNTAPLLAAEIDGTGINVAIIGQTLYKTDTVNPVKNWRKKFGFSTTTAGLPTDVLVPGTGVSQINDGNNEGETLLDLEWEGGVAPGSKEIFVYTGSNTDNFSVNDSVNYVVDMGPNLPGTNGKGAQIMSESYGSCEAFYLPADADIDGEVAAAANLEGITYLASSGDSGAASCANFGIGGLWVSPPASLPGVLAVGGTEFGTTALADTTAFNTKTNTVLGYPVDGSGTSLESVWDDHQVFQGTLYFGAGGGGASQVFSKPYWQQGVTPSDNARDVPDVSLTASADNLGYWINGPLADGSSATSYEYYPIGGTSAASPSFAGILALVEQKIVANGGNPNLGNVSPALYALAKSHPEAFHDIVTGNNIGYCDNDKSDTSYDPNCPTTGNYGGYTAVKGYDQASGLGSVDANALATAWAANDITTTTLAASAVSTDVGTPITLTATVTRKAMNATAIAGKVTFAFETLAGDAGATYTKDAGGGYDDAWSLGDVAVTANADGTGTATLSTKIPPGLGGQAYVVAEYGGDGIDLPSVSPETTVKVTGSTLAITPSTITLHPGAQMAFTVTGNHGGVSWGEEGTDTTCLVDMTTGQQTCSLIESKDATTGYFQAGGQAGQVTIVAVDGDGQEAAVVVTVAGSTVDAGPYPMFDAGPFGPGIADASAPVSTSDASTGTDSGTTGGSDASVGDDDDDSGTVVIGTGDDDSGTTPVSTGDASVRSDAGNGNGDNGGSDSGGCAVAGTQTHGTRSSEMLGMGLLFGLVSLVRSKKRTSA